MTLTFYKHVKTEIEQRIYFFEALKRKSIIDLFSVVAIRDEVIKYHINLT